MLVDSLNVMDKKSFYQNVISTPAKTGGEILYFSVVKRSLPAVEMAAYLRYITLPGGIFEVLAG
jgi:hypothetical protein